MNKKEIAGLVLCLWTLWFVSCSNSDKTITGNGTRTGNPTIAGVLYQDHGATPAKNAQVHLCKKSFLSDPTKTLAKRLVDTVTVTTADDGSFHIDSVDIGVYVIEYKGDGNNLAINDSVVVRSGDSMIMVPPDTLKPAGAIQGTITLSEGGDPRQVYVLAYGIDRYTRVSTDGSFLFAGLAQGNYDFRVISGLVGYGASDMIDIPVGSNDTTDLGAIGLPFFGTPAIKNIRIAFDTLKQIVRLSWNKADTTLIRGFNIYKKHVESDSGFIRITPKPIGDTVFFDSTCVEGQTYAFRISIVNKDSTEGRLSQDVSVRMISYFQVDTVFDLHLRTENEREQQSYIAFNGSDLFYIIDESTVKVKVFDTNFTLIRELSDESMQNVGGVAVGGDGRVFVAERDTSTWKLGLIKSIFIFNATGGLYKKLPVRATGNENGNAVGIDARLFTVDSKDRIVFVNDGQDSIYLCDTAGAILTKWVGADTVEDPLDRKGAIASVKTDRHDNIYADNYQVGMKVYDSMGALKRSVATLFGMRRDGIPIRWKSSAFSVEPGTDRIFYLDYSGVFSVFSPQDEFIATKIIFYNGGWSSDILFSGNRIYVVFTDGTNGGRIYKVRNVLP